ncbi:error-prone DNA polymerase [Methylovirgula sp. 4M-Z18]|uniref:error-prone DNA polymerase n=1 Tax=Methylovirgula sp. 4M-Z18 TaxID=2293567 RepID=UPI000E2E7917|nr:error-prone DNA polymerase [Methylovirgula sp. 4M-Z18]RFB78673.1 DNA polymerase III subunit alpha [Methylovirgula sp. 4M-Z18]
MSYAELAVMTNYSFLRGASKPGELVARAKELGYAGIGIADRNSLAGMVRAHVAAKNLGIKLAVGAHLVFADDTPEMLAYPTDRAAYGRLTRLLTTGNLRTGKKGICELTKADLFDYSEGLLFIVLPPARLDAAFTARMQALIEALPQQIWLGATMPRLGSDRRRLHNLRMFAKRLHIKLIAIGDVLYHAPERRVLQDVLTCIREHVTIEAAGYRLETNAERHLKPHAEIARLFRDDPAAVEETTRFLAKLDFNLDELGYEYPHEPYEGYSSPGEALADLADKGARNRYGGIIPEHIKKALAYELEIISRLKYEPYFLTVYDIVKFARSEDILCQGRGSAANSAVCYCLGITEISPERVNGLLFERFVSENRNEPPDIDVDFEHEKREKVIQYIYKRYGRKRAGIAATVITYRSRSAIRDVGKVFGLSEDAIGALSHSTWGSTSRGISDDEARRVGLDPDDPRLAKALTLAKDLTGFPRHLSQHVGGFVLTRYRLDESVPIGNAAMDDRTFIEWDKDDLDAVGMMKVDVLALGMLTAIKKMLDLLKRHYGVHKTLASIPEGHERVYNMIQRADTLGVFQIESRAQMSMLPRLKPVNFYDLVIEVAIVRPGPIQGNMVHPYLQRRQNPSSVVFPSPSPEEGPANELEDVLGKTLGVPLFQEQAMRIAIVAAKFTPAEADQLRRAMATFRHAGTIHQFESKLIEGMVKRGYAREFAERCFRQIKGFGEYGFPESHAASFALLVYASAYLKCYYPDVFAAGLLNAQPLGFYSPGQIVRDAREHGIEVRAPDINASHWDATLELGPPHPPHEKHASMVGDIKTTHALRLGFRQIKGFSQDDANCIADHRGEGYDSIRDLWLRTRLHPSVLERLADADAFTSLGLSRRDALWIVRGLGRAGDKEDLPLLSFAQQQPLEPDMALPPMLAGEHVVMDYRYLHLSLKAHPLSFLRRELQLLRISPCDDLRRTEDDRRVSVAGLVTVRQRPGTAKGTIFLTLEDETGIANIIVWPKTFEIFRAIVLGARFIRATGRLQSESGVTHIVADTLEDMTARLSALQAGKNDLQDLAHADEIKRGTGDDPRQKNRPPIEPDIAIDLDVPARATRHVPARMAG